MTGPALLPPPTAGCTVFSKFFTLPFHNLSTRPFVWRARDTPHNTHTEQGPVWTVKFNVRGTRLATGGQDGKVVVWDLAELAAGSSSGILGDGHTPPAGASGGAQPPSSRSRSSTGGFSPQGASSADGINADEAQRPQGKGAESGSTAPRDGFDSYPTAVGDNVGGDDDDSEGPPRRGESLVRSDESVSFGSAAVSEDGNESSTERGSSDLGLSGRGQKGQGFSGVEVSTRCNHVCRMACSLLFGA